MRKLRKMETEGPEQLGGWRSRTRESEEGNGESEGLGARSETVGLQKTSYSEEKVYWYKIRIE